MKDQIKIQVNELKAALAAEIGPKVIRTLVDALLEEARRDAFTHLATGQVDISISVIDEAVIDPEVRGELRTAALRAFPLIHEIVRCEKRQKWSKDREHERNLARAI